MNIYQKVAYGIALSSLSLGAIASLPATAATLTYNFNLEGKTVGNFSFNNSNVQGSSLEKVSLLSFTFNFLGNTITQSQLKEGGVYFWEGNFRGLGGSVSGYDRSCINSGIHPGAYSYCQFSASFVFYENYADPNDPDYVLMGNNGKERFYDTLSYELISTSESEGNTETVPEPTSIGALLGLGIFKWNQSRQKKLKEASK